MSLRFVVSIFISLSLIAIAPNSFAKPSGPRPQDITNATNYTGKGKSSKGPEIDKEAQDCDKAAKEAAKQCDDKGNQNSQQATNNADQYSQQQQQSQGANGGGGPGAQGECGGLENLMKPLADLLNKAAGQCAGANEACKSACKKPQQAQSKCAGLQGDDAAKCQGDAQQAGQFGAKQEGNCGAQGANVGAFLAAAATAALQASQMKKCKKDTELDCSKPENSQDPKCADKAVLNCADPKFAADPKCICQQNPRAAGCPGSENPSDVTRASKEKREKSSTGGDGMPSGSPSVSEQLAPKANAAGLPFSPAGGGAGGGKGLDAVKGQELGGAPKGMGADILAGDYGGGGGGSKPGGGGYPDGDPRGGALAKAKKAAERRLASQGAWTGAMGRSNWDKIKDRYRENRPTLMNVDR